MSQRWRRSSCSVHGRSKAVEMRSVSIQLADLNAERSPGCTDPIGAAREVAIGPCCVSRGGRDLATVVFGEVELAAASLQRRLEPLNSNPPPTPRGRCRCLGSLKARESTD